MMSSMPLETCSAFNKLWNNKFYYKVASCWLFLLIPTTMHGSMSIKFRDLYVCKECYLTTMSNAKVNPIFGRGWMKEIWLQSNGRIILTGQNSSTERKPCISAIFSATNPTRSALWSKSIAVAKQGKQHGPEFTLLLLLVIITIIIISMSIIPRCRFFCEADSRSCNPHPPVIS